MQGGLRGRNAHRRRVAFFRREGTPLVVLSLTESLKRYPLVWVHVVVVVVVAVAVAVAAAAAAAAAAVVVVVVLLLGGGKRRHAQLLF